MKNMDFIVISLLVVASSSQVSGWVVLTNSSVTLQEGASGMIPCTVEEKLYALYWSHGPTYHMAERLLWIDLYFDFGRKSGPKFEDGSMDIGANFTLIIKNVTVEFEGRFFCEVSDFKTGMLYRNQTDVSVRDATYFMASTLQNNSGWNGWELILPCNISGLPKQVSWVKNSSQLVTYDNDTDAIRTNGRFSWAPNFGLWIHDLDFFDEGIYTCQVWKKDWIYMDNSTNVTVDDAVLPNPPFVRVEQCGETYRLDDEGGANTPFCDYRSSSDHVVLDCAVLGARPAPSVSWLDPKTGLAMNNITTNQSSIGNGIYNASARLSVGHLKPGDESNYTCSAIGPAVNGTANLAVRLTYTLTENGQTHHIVGGVIGVFAFLALLFILVAFIWRRKKTNAAVEWHRW